jgi:hypothetical protein
MSYNFQKKDLVLMALGLIGVMLLWMNVDPGGWVLYTCFFLFGCLRVVDYFKLSPYERNRNQVLRLVFSAAMIITVITHLIWGGIPLYGLLAALLLLNLVMQFEPLKEEKTS